MAERSRDRLSSAESQPKFPRCSHFRRRNDNHYRCQQCRLNEGLILCTQDKPCFTCKDWLPEAWTAQAKASAQKTRRKAAAKKASERETMDDSFEILKRRYNSLPSGPAATGPPSRNRPRPKPQVLGRGQRRQRNLLPGLLGPVNRSPWFPAFLKWDGPALTGRTATDREVRTRREDTGRTNARTPPDVQSPAVFPRRRTPVLRPLPFIIVITSHRAIKDPCHHPHLGRLPTVSHCPVIMREDERAPIGPDLRTSPDGKCSCLPRSPSLPRRELSLWSLRRPGRFK